MASAASEQIPFPPPPPPPPPPTYRFRPTKRELVEFYLLPCARGRDKFPGVLFEDEAAGSALPWDLFERHGVGSEDEAYFLVRGGRGGEAAKKRGGEAKKPGARHRQDRGCDGGGGAWKMQSSAEKCLRVRGERIRVHVSNLNLHLGKGKGKDGGGSVGWVMHEYTIAAPPCPSPVKICHIAFSGHGRKRMRVPGAQEPCQSSTGHAASGGGAMANGSSASHPPCSWATTMLDHGSSSGVAYAYASGDEESSRLVLTDGDGDNFRQSPLLGDGSDDFQGFFPSAASEQYPEVEAQVWPTEQQQGIVAPQTMMVAQQSTMPVVRQLSARELEFWSDNSFEQESATGVQSSSLVVPPNNGAMAGDLDFDDLCRSILATNARTNWVASDFSNVTTTGTLGGGFSLQNSAYCK